MQHSVIGNAEQNIALLTMILSAILAPDGERIFERKPSDLKAHIVANEVRCGFSVIPLELVIALATTA